jgi:hypothetical protein
MPTQGYTGMHQQQSYGGSYPQPGMYQPGMPQPVMPQPGMYQPGMPQPGMYQPGMPQPNMPQPGMPQPGIQQPFNYQSPAMGYPSQLPHQPMHGYQVPQSGYSMQAADQCHSQQIQPSYSSPQMPQLNASYGAPPQQPMYGSSVPMQQPVTVVSLSK